VLHAGAHARKMSEKDPAAERALRDMIGRRPGRRISSGGGWRRLWDARVGGRSPPASPQGLRGHYTMSIEFSGRRIAIELPAGTHRPNCHVLAARSEETAPCGDQARIDRNSLLNARAFTPFIGLVRHVRVAGAEDDGRDIARRAFARRHTGSGSVARSTQSLSCVDWGLRGRRQRRPRYGFYLGPFSTALLCSALRRIAR
jgi:hypothetical protein